MEQIINRYRNVLLLAVAILAQLALLAYQIKSNQDVRLIRVWAVSAVTPMARVLEAGRSGSSRFFGDYFALRHVHDENNQLKSELDRVKMENQYLRTELNTADRAKNLAIFEKTSPSKLLAARVIGNSTASSGKVVLIDRGTNSNVQRGMAVTTPDGIVGKIIMVYPTASQVLLINDPSFAAGVISQKNRVHGTLRGQGYGPVIVDYVQNETKLDQGEWFYTSGDDRIFPKGLPVGIADIVRPGVARKEIYVTPSGLQNGIEEVFVIIEGVHAPIPDAVQTNQPVHILSAPPADPAETYDAPSKTPGQLTDADRVVEHYRGMSAARGHSFGEKGSPPPNFNVDQEKTPQKPPAP